MKNDTKKIYFLRLPGEWPWLNKIITDCKKLTYTKGGKLLLGKNGKPVTGIAYSNLKSKTEKKMSKFVDFWIPGLKITGNAFFYIRIYGKDRRKDPNNLKVMDKFVCDLLQTMEVFAGDGWPEMSAGFMTKFGIDKKNPRVDIWIHTGFDIDLEIDESYIVNSDQYQRMGIQANLPNVF